VPKDAGSLRIPFVMLDFTLLIAYEFFIRCFANIDDSISLRLEPMNMTNNRTTEESVQRRFALGVSIFVLALFVPLLIPVVISSSLPSGWKVTLSGLLAFGIPEVLMLLAAMVLGKSGFKYLKQRAFLLVKRYVLPKSVSRIRYRIGLVLFLLTVVMSWLALYLCPFIPFLKDNQLLVGVLSDMIFLISLFVLGGDFWDKLKALFMFEAKAHLPDQSH